jgi:hypothetical protein
MNTRPATLTTIISIMDAKITPPKIADHLAALKIKAIIQIPEGYILF